MSFKQSAIANVIVFLPLLIGLLVVFSFNIIAVHPMFWLYISGILSGFGFIFFLVSKLSVIKGQKSVFFWLIWNDEKESSFL